MKYKRILFLSALLTAAIALSLCVGRYKLSIPDIVDVCLGKCVDDMKIAVFLKIRLPRTLTALLSGAALSLAGWLYQSIFMNTLVSPDVLGVNGGCSVGAIISILVGASGAYIQLTSFAAGILTVVLTLLLARAIGRHSSVSMLMAGIVISALANSCIMLLKYVADPHSELAAIEYWLMGSFHAAKWDQFTDSAAIILPCAAIILLLAHPVRLLAYGDDEARSIGVPAGAVKYISLIAATGMVAGVISASGSISWLGLIVPHICRISGGETAHTPFEVCITGSILLLIADALARSLTSGEIPISIITSLMGAIFLLVILIARASHTGRASE